MVQEPRIFLGLRTTTDPSEREMVGDHGRGCEGGRMAAGVVGEA